VNYRGEVGEGRQRKRRRGKAIAAKNLEFAAEDVEDVTAIAAAVAASNEAVAAAVGNRKIR
jgi:hypothetical protein